MLSRPVATAQPFVGPPLSDLVGECGQTKATRKKGTKKTPWHWDDVHQQAFDAVKKALARDVMLAYPKHDGPFEICADASSRQLGAVIAQDERILALFSRKLSIAQQKHSVTELELLSIVECLKSLKACHGVKLLRFMLITRTSLEMPWVLRPTECVDGV